MSDSEINFLSREEALKIVAAIQEEEDIHRQDKRILTVYNHENKELCWFDFDDLYAEIGEGMKLDEFKEIAENYVINHIPDWAIDI